MKPPFTVIILSCLFIIAGITGIIYHASDFKLFDVYPEMIWVLIVRLLAIVGGVFAIKGANWARWLLLAWIAYHVSLSFKHTMSELLIHLALFIAVAYIFFLSKAKNFYRKD